MVELKDVRRFLLRISKEAEIPMRFPAKLKGYKIMYKHREKHFVGVSLRKVHELVEELERGGLDWKQWLRFMILHEKAHNELDRIIEEKGLFGEILPVNSDYATIIYSLSLDYYINGIMLRDEYQKVMKQARYITLSGLEDYIFLWIPEYELVRLRDLMFLGLQIALGVIGEEEVREKVPSWGFLTVKNIVEVLKRIKNPEDLQHAIKDLREVY